MWRARTLLRAAGAVGLLVVTFGVASAAGTLSPTGTLSPNERLGKAIFFDENLSLNRNLACASCHGAAVGFTGPLSAINQHGAVYEGSVAGAFGNRKPPSSAYTTMSPILHFDATMGWVGGNFWDGRATGAKLGIPAADQAQGPSLHPAEQALPAGPGEGRRGLRPHRPLDRGLRGVRGGELLLVEVRRDDDGQGEAHGARAARPDPVRGQGWLRRLPLATADRGCAVHGLHVRQPRHPPEPGEPGRPARRDIR